MSYRGYRFACQWVADNDCLPETLEGSIDFDAATGLISVALVADIFRKTPDQVVRDVVKAVKS